MNKMNDPTLLHINKLLIELKHYKNKLENKIQELEDFITNERIKEE
jgi:hypothetical protein